MLEKNKDYLEMRVSSTDCAFTQNAATQISVDGYVYTPYMNLPTPGEFYILISKEKFEKLQTENEELKKKLGEFDFMGWMESAKLWKKRYDDIFKLIGFSSDEELHDYLANDAECDTLREAIASLEHNVKFARDERRDLSKKLDECEKDYISERDKVTALQIENEQLKKKLQVPDPFAEYKELLEKLHSKEDIEKFEWTLNHICGGQASANGWMVTAKLWRRNYETLSKLVGFSSTEEIQDYLTNEAECDTLQEAVSKLKDQVEYTCDEWYSADSIHQWQKVTGYDNPKDFLKWKANIEGIVEAWKSETGCKYPGDARRLLEKWQTMTKCETPEAAATWITSYEKACGRGNRLAKMVEKLKEEVVSWKNVTGYSTPEDYMHARISGAFHTPFDYTAAWQKVTGCDTPDQVKSRIEGLENAVRLMNRNMIKEIESNIDEWQKATGCDTPVKAERKITDLYKIIEGWKKVTGCSTPEVAEDWVNELGEANGNLAQAVLSWQNVTGCSTPKDLSKKLVEWEKVFTPHMSARDLCSAMSNAIKYYKHKFAPWEEITGFSTPENCSSYIDTLEKKLEDIKDLIGED